MNRLFHILFLPVFILSQLSVSASNLGTPFVQHFSKGIYQGSGQNWEMLQAEDGRLLFANNDGLLVFDGQYWGLNPLPKRTIVRSLAIGPSGRIYVGGQDELGYFAPNQNSD